MNLYKKIIVNNWINYEKFKQHEIEVYIDDNLENVIAKIGYTINNDKGRFYVWKGNKSILFDIKSIKWSGYSPNPLESKKRKSKQLKEPIIYDYKYQLFTYSTINIIYEDDFDDLKDNPYYFTDKTFLSLSQLNKKESILKKLETTDISPIIDKTLNIHRYELISKLTRKYLLVELFERLNTTSTIQFIQWINDNYKTMYKLLKINKLTKEMLINWTDMKKNNTINCINCYSILTSGTYAKLTIKDNMEITLSYTINLRKNIIWDEIYANINEIKIYCNTFLKKKLNFEDLSIKANLVFEIDNVPIQSLKKKISEYTDIFDILKSNKDTINLIYKRSSNYNEQGFDAHAYVKNCLYLGIEDEDIIKQLVILNNMTDEEAKNLLKEEQELIYEMEQQNIKKQENINKTNTIVIIELYKNGYYINIINIPNKKELDNIQYWLSKIMCSSIQKTLKKKKEIVEDKQPIYKKADSSSFKNDEDDDIGKLSYSSSDNEEMSGGALGADKHSYFINLLKKADKDLFSNNYARKKCQAVNQPVVMTQEYRDKLKKEGNYHFDNEIIYGSKPNIKNVYTCPRLWCPQSKISLDPSKPDQTCPIENEEPMELFYNNNKNKKRYVKLIKPDENNICAPCCAKTESKEADLNKCKYYKTEEEKPKETKKPSIKEKEKVINEDEVPDIIDDKGDNYLVNISPVKVGRFGVIPQTLHELLLPSTNYSVCSKMLNKSNKCFVRRGISHKTSKKSKNTYNDSLINAIAIGLGFNNKSEFIKNLVKELDLIKFMSLENGNVCKSFIDRIPVIPENNKKLIIELENHLKLFNLTTKLKSVDFKKDNYKLSRLLGVFKSYKKFINYLSSNDYPTNKSPYYLYSLISILHNVLLVIWEKQTNSTNILCPYYTSFDDLISSMELNPQLLMIIKEKTYYEPIELKIKGKDGEQKVRLNDYDHIKNLFKECSIIKHEYEINNKIYNNIYSLNNWVKSSLLTIKTKFIINTIIINSDLSISHYLTNGNIMIITDKISISFLPRLIIDLEISNIVFYDDIINTDYVVNMQIKDYKLFTGKCNYLDIKYDFGELTDETAKEYYYTLTIKKMNIPNDIIHSQIIDDLYRYNIHNNKINKKWYQLQLAIYGKILNMSDEKFEELLQLSKKQRILRLFKELSFIDKKNGDINLIKIPEKNKIRVILEEIPFISKNHIKKYFNDYVMYYKYDFLNPLIKETKYQFIFSQTSLYKSIPPQLIVYHESTPNSTFNTSQTRDYIFNSNTSKNDIELPALFKGTYEKLNSKWIKHKKSKWINMVYIKTEKYDRSYIENFYLWLADLLNTKTDYKDVISSAKDKMKSIFSVKFINEKVITKTKFQIKNLFEDPWFLECLNRILDKKYINFNIFWEKYYSVISVDERKLLLNNILKTYELYPNDYYILSISELLNVNIITIHRSKYGSNKKDEEIVRGDIEDLKLSSTFYKAPTNYENRPLIILNKYDDGRKIIYNLVVDETLPLNQNIIYIKMSDVPLAVKYLINEHIKV